MNFDSSYTVNTLIELCNTPSVTGDTTSIQQKIKEEIKSMDVPVTENNKGGIIATISGRAESSILVSAHVDTLGAMVKGIKGNGRLTVSPIGSFDFNSIETENCVIHSAESDFNGSFVTTKGSVHIHGGETAKQSRDKDTLEIRLDEDVSSKEDTENLGISVGDFVSFDPRVIKTSNGYIKSRHLDDKAGVAIILQTIKSIKERNITPKKTIKFFISNYEEVGHGCSHIPENTEELIAIDMGVVGEGQQGNEHSVSICAKDSSGPYDLQMRRSFVQICKENNIPHKIDIFPYYGSDASAALRAGNNIRAGLIGPGVDNSHSYERTHLDALKATFELLFQYLTT
ncbi:M42 family metallopeptidase [Proteinivorax hydrogeniformans]|uniref:M42 family metallopeptidase n=1 Tax=Proteinivorax hydrogeniformans TaxID=1826727 RepID=A0AAU8HPP2_9FIRM